jgi:hypothetical protein
VYLAGFLDAKNESHVNIMYDLARHEIFDALDKYDGFTLIF